MNKLNEFIKWIVNNKEWMFSGAGISIIGLVAILFKNISNSSDKKEIKSKSISLNVNEQLQQKIEKSSLGSINNEMLELVDRFISIYSNHGILINQIPSFINPEFGLRLSDFKDKQSVLQILDDRIINWTCETFGIQRDWLDGKTNEIYRYEDYYKNITSFINRVEEIKKLCEDNFELYLIKNGKLNPNIYGRYYVIMIFKYKIGELNGSYIYRYLPVSTKWDWGYWRCRYQLKTIIYLCKRMRIYAHGYDMPLDIIDNISSGIVFPEEQLKKIPIVYTWYPDDYIYRLSESPKAKEAEEIDLVMQYIEDEGFLEYSCKSKNTIEKVKSK